MNSDDRAPSYDELLRERNLYEMALRQVVHDGRNPTNIVLAYAELLDEEVEGEDTVDYVNRILEAGEQLEAVFNTGASLMGGEQYDRINIYQAIRDCVDTYGERAQEEAGITVRYEGPDASCYINTDVRVPQVFDNLLENTLAHAEGADEAVFTAYEEDDSVVVEYSDDGPGLPAEMRDSITEFGEKGDTSGGLGWGMSLSTYVLEESGADWRIGDSESGGFLMEMRFPYTRDADE